MVALQGVNLGGWLVLERWMTPGVFEGVKARDERGLGRELGLRAARDRLTTHRDSFISESDFEFIKSTGCDFIRLPVGYWLFEEVDGYIQGQIYVDQAFNWAKKYDLGIILDFHGLPGSQNGKIHSGEVGLIEFYQPDNIKAGVRAVEYAAKRYGSEQALIGLQVINEPYVRLCPRRLLQFYEQTYEAADKWLAPGVKVVVSDAFKPGLTSWMLQGRNFGDRLVLDVHLYQIFGDKFQDMSLDQHLVYANSQQKLLKALGRKVPILVGEWSGALPAKARQEVVKAELKFIEIQQKVFDENVWAHCYWSYKKTGRGAWNWRATLHDS